MKKNITIIFLLLFISSIYSISDKKQMELNDELRYAITNNNIPKIKKLIRKGADVNTRDFTYFNMSILLEAYEYERFEIVKILIQSGADVNIQGNYGYTALMYAATGKSKEDFEIGKLLLKKNADVNIKCSYGRTALMFASINGKTELVKLILENNPDVNIKDKNNRTALIDSCEKNFIEIAILLIEKGADVNVRDESGYTPILHTSEYEIIKSLVENGADVNDKNIRMYGFTPLMEASYRGDLETVEFLLNNGADINQKSNDGETALDSAESFKELIEKFLLDEEKKKYIKEKINNEKIIKLLLKKGCKKGIDL